MISSLVMTPLNLQVPPKNSASLPIIDNFRRRFPRFQGLPHILSLYFESPSSSPVGSHKSTSKYEISNPDSPISLTLLATKFPSLRREMLLPGDGPKDKQNE